MTNLFQNLFRLRLNHNNNPLEDFTTEILSSLIQVNVAFRNRFLEMIGVDRNRDFLYCKTQVTFKAHPTHNSDSKVDMVIYLVGHTIFIECKIESKEGEEKLKRYADHLNGFQGQKTLVYLTKYYENKNLTGFAPGLETSIDFKLARWFQVYRVCCEAEPSNLLYEFTEYLKQNKLAMNNQFTPSDILALTNFNNVFALMREIMFTEVLDSFSNTFGGSSVENASMAQIRHHNRYTYYKFLLNSNPKVLAMLGFWFQDPNDPTYPELKLVIEIHPGCENHDGLREVLKNQLNELNEMGEEDQKWFGYNLYKKNDFTQIGKAISLKSILGEDDQIDSAKTFFKRAIEEYNHINSILILK